MSTVNGASGVNTDVNYQVLDPEKLSQQDFIAAVYLERGNMLDSEVRRIIADIETSNNLLNSVNTMISKANIAQYSDSEYDNTTWTVNGNNIVLDNGYGLAMQTDGNGESIFTLVDAEGNQLIYQNQTLIPTPSGTNVDAQEIGIPVMNDMTMVLDDGTELTFKTANPDVAFDPQNFSGGQTDILSIHIKRGNQGLEINDFNTGSPAVVGPDLNGDTLDSLDNDGHVLLEAGGLHSWEYDGVNLGGLTRTDPNNPDVQVSGYAARKLAFRNSISNEYSGGAPALTQAEMDTLTNVLKITVDDASGKGNLTPEEWALLKNHLEAAKENLTGSNQLQTVQLQRAMLTYNQNYDAMSNSENKIYSLLRDIVNNIK